MTDHIIVQFVGFEVKPLVREYTFTVRERDTEPRQFTLTILNEAFNTRRVRFQDAPDVCSRRLYRELASAANHPLDSHFDLTNAELEDYRIAHTPKSHHSYPHPAKQEQDA